MYKGIDPLVYLFALCSIPSIHVMGYYLPQTYFTGVLVFTFVLVPLIDKYIPRFSETNKDSEMYRAVLYSYEIFYTVVFFFSLHKSTQLINNPILFVLHAVSLGTCTSAPGNAVSHELFHKLNPLDRFLGQWHLVLTYYSHFHIEHVYGHHKNVGTKSDPATARYGETFYQFLPRSTIGGIINSYNIEAQRIGVGASWCSFLTGHRVFRNIVLFYILFPIMLYNIMGVLPLITFFVQATVAILFIEGINYVEHYGLERKLLDDGTYEKVTDMHSWDAPQDFSSYFYVNIMLHSDHHSRALKDYEKLERKHHAATMKYDYNIMILTVYIPSLFFSITHPLLKAHKEKNGIL